MPEYTIVDKQYYGEFAPQRHLFVQYGVTENE